jgi:tetraacyldisaccharide 4'-kinase
MRIATPRWWYLRGRQPMPVMRRLLAPASLIWAAATARRIARGQPVDPGALVICVGNVTMGGAGKTPVVRALVDRLGRSGVTAHILTRGHGGRITGPLRVDQTTSTSEQVGDEALMMSSDAPVWVARDRLAGARMAARAGAQVIVMDDGHQNPTVRKALSLIVVDGETRHDEWPFGDGAVFPAGPMREPLAAGLARADAVVLLLPADLSAPEPDLIDLLRGRPILLARLVPSSPPPPGPQIGFAGIGKPWKMERALKAAGCDLVDFTSLPDHVGPGSRMLATLAARAAALGAGLVTSEKDWVRLTPPWRARVTPWPVRVRFEDEAALDRLLAPILSGA